MIHFFAGFVWWGMVVFLTVILLPKLPQMKKETQYELIGYVIPRIFNMVSNFGFFAVFLGWFNILNYFADWKINYFLNHMIFSIDILLITGLYIFHLFLEKDEITLAFSLLNRKTNAPTDDIDKLILRIRKIPYVGFIVLTIGIITMFYH